MKKQTVVLFSLSYLLFALISCENNSTLPSEQIKSLPTQINCHNDFSAELVPLGADGVIKIKDPIFEHSLYKFDSDKKVNGQILLSDAIKIVELDLSNRKQTAAQPSIKSFEGIQYFENLRVFKTIAEEVDTLDLRFNKKLEILFFSGYIGGGGGPAAGKVIVVGKNDNLKKIYTGITLIKQLDLRGTPNVEEVGANGINLEYVYVSDLRKVKKDWLLSGRTGCRFVTCR